MKIKKANLNAVLIGLVLSTLSYAAVADTSNVEVYGNVSVGVGNVNSIPEPDTILLIGLGAAAIWVARRIKK